MTIEKNIKYHVDTTSFPTAYTDEQLQQWSADPDCIERETCAKWLTDRIAKRESDRTEHEAELAAKRHALLENPFDPRTEISADARHIAGRIVKHLWILFVLLPVIAVVLVAILSIK